MSYIQPCDRCTEHAVCYLATRTGRAYRCDKHGDEDSTSVNRRIELSKPERSEDAERFLRAGAMFRTHRWRSHGDPEDGDTVCVDCDLEPHNKGATEMCPGRIR